VGLRVAAGRGVTGADGSYCILHQLIALNTEEVKISDEISIFQ
jgi:hypothetical protein